MELLLSVWSSVFLLTSLVRSMTSLQPSRISSIGLRHLFLIMAIFGNSFVMVTLCSWPAGVSVSDEVGSPSSLYKYYFDSRFTIKTNGCTIPSLRPYDDSIKRYIQPPRRIKPCRHMYSPLLSRNQSHIMINKNNLHYYNLSQDSAISCCYNAFYRPNTIADITSRKVDERVKYHECVKFTDSIEALDEFVRVICTEKKKLSLYEDYFLFARQKPNHAPNNRTQMAYNVIVLGIDSVSRLNLYRTLPKTLNFLKNKGAVELYGYNKVGDNTFPNLVAMLLGVKDTELKRMCWPSRRSTFDNCPFLWDLYKENGFYTALGEDSAHLGTFNYARRGFAATPTDYYLHTFTREAETHVGNNNYLCMGATYASKVLLDYVENLARKLKSSKLFGFFWEVTMSHDYLNNPKALDVNYEQLLINLDESTYLDKTIVILLSDHGLRWGKFRSTKQGHLEERLPFVHILVPPSFQQNYSSAYQNLRLNGKHLTTPFDMHATLTDLADLKSITDENISARSKQYYAHDRSISLFLPIPQNRTCKLAGIDDHWCTCHKDRSLPVDRNEAREAADFVVAHMNELLKERKECARLALAEIIEVREMEAGTPAVDEEGWRELLVLVRATPGEGVFEATLRRTAIGVYELAGSISRLNLYGDQSRCVDDYVIKLYCVCTEIKTRRKTSV